MKQILFILLFPIGLFAQEWDVYRIKAIQNGDTTVVSVSNTIEVPKTQLIYIPTVFSPDGDGINDLFYVKGQNIGHLCLEVYNRWGQEVLVHQPLETDGMEVTEDKPVQWAPMYTDSYGTRRQLKQEQ